MRGKLLFKQDSVNDAHINEMRENAGVAAKTGYQYQDFVVAHLLICGGIREVWVEEDGEDILAFGDIPDTSTRIFYQCKYRSSGAIPLGIFLDLTVAKLHDLYKKPEYEVKFLKIKLISNINVSEEVNRVLRVFKRISKREISWEWFEQRYGRKYKFPQQILRRTPNLSNISMLERIVSGVQYENKTIHGLKMEILFSLSQFGILNPKKKLLKVMGYIYDKKRGLITRSELENLLNIEFVLKNTGTSSSITYTNTEASDANELLKNTVTLLDDIFLDTEKDYREQFITKAKIESSVNTLIQRKVSKLDSDISQSTSESSKKEKTIYRDYLLGEMTLLPEKLQSAESSGMKYVKEREKVENIIHLASDLEDEDDV